MLDDPQFGTPIRQKPIAFFAFYRTKRNLQKIIDNLEAHLLRATLKKDFELDQQRAEEYITQLKIQIIKYEDSLAGLEEYPHTKRRFYHSLLIMLYNWAFRTPINKS